VPDKTLVTINH